MKNQPQSRGNQRDKRGPRPQDRWNNKPRFRPEEGDENMLEGRNAVTEALRSGREIDKIYFASGAVGTLGHLIAQARQKGITAQEIDRRKLDAMSITGSHQGIIALCAAVPYRSLEDMLALARERGEKPLLVLCDGITDPHNLGAIIRTAEIAGAHGVVIPRRRQRGLRQSCRRRPGIPASGQGEQHCLRRARAEKARLVPLCRRYGWPADVIRSRFHPAHRHRHWQRGHRGVGAGQARVRFCGAHPAKRAHPVAERIQCSGCAAV